MNIGNTDISNFSYSMLTMQIIGVERQTLLKAVVCCYLTRAWKVCAKVFIIEVREFLHELDLWAKIVSFYGLPSLVSLHKI